MDFREYIPTYGELVGNVNVVVEIPKGTVNKYEIDENTGSYLKVVRTLHPRYKYIYNYGFIPQTMAPDGDQLDAIVIADEVINPLTIIECKVVGVVTMIDKGEQDDKILVVPKYSKKKSFNLSKILHYLKNYKYPDQAGTELGDVFDSDTAMKIIEKCHNVWRNKDEQ